MFDSPRPDIGERAGAQRCLASNASRVRLSSSPQCRRPSRPPVPPSAIGGVVDRGVGAGEPGSATAERVSWVAIWDPGRLQIGLERGSIPRRPATEGAAEWPATGPENRGGGDEPQGFDSSAFLHGAFDFRRGHRSFKAIRRDRHPHALPRRIRLDGPGRRPLKAETRVRVPHSTRDAHASGPGADATNVGRGGSTPSVGATPAAPARNCLSYGRSGEGSTRSRYQRSRKRRACRFCVAVC